MSPAGLFIDSWSSHHRQLIENASVEVRQFTKGFFDDPALAGKLDNIADRYTLNVARLERSQINARRRVESKRVQDYGDIQILDVSMLDVMVPFRGDRLSFQFGPSNYTLPKSAQVTAHELILTLVDDDRVQQEVDRFCDIIEGNLKLLFDEVRRDKLRLRQIIGEVADQRKKELITLSERDSKLKFPVR